MFDTIYAELDCPFCGRQFRHMPLSWEQAQQDCQEQKERELKHMRTSDHLFDEVFQSIQIFRARADVFTVREGEHEQEDILIWIEQFDSPEYIERWRTRKELGLAGIQTKAFDSALVICFNERRSPCSLGTHYIEEAFPCKGCSPEEREYVKTWIEIAWIEIEEHRIKAVLTHNPETGQPEKDRPLASLGIIGLEVAKTSFKDWQAEQLKDPEYVAVLNEPEPGYQIARLCIQRGLTQAQLAEMVGAREATIARLESGSSTPSLSLLRQIAEALDAKIELRLIAKDV